MRSSAQGTAFCNPVKKRKGSRLLADTVSDRQHLKAYRVFAVAPALSMQRAVTNQLGTDVVISFEVQPASLMVPTRKFPHKFPNGLDHFLCHKVVSGPSAEAQFKLVDQFRRYKKMRVGEPRSLCAPTAKAHDGKVVLPRHPQVHLVCYAVSDRKLDPKRKRRFSNQFEKRKRITAKRTSELCVPSTARPVG